MIDFRRLRRTPMIGALILAMGMLAIGCRPKDGTDDGSGSIGGQPAMFEEFQQEAGLNFIHDPGPPGTWFYPEIMISGAALLDYDRDGDLDVYMLNCGAAVMSGVKRDPSVATNRLFRQDEGGKFVDVTAESGLGDQGYGIGVAVGDVNNDGYPDIFITNYGGDRMFVNLGNGKFEDMTSQCGITNERWSAAACFLDFDRDGWLDLYVSNYVDYFPTRKCYGASGRRDYCGPAGFDKTVDRLFRNVTGDNVTGDNVTGDNVTGDNVTGDNVTGDNVAGNNVTGDNVAGSSGSEKGDSPAANVQFQDVSLASGIAKRQGSGLGVLSSDFNGDGWQDIYVANDMVANFLWINQGDGTFRDEALTRGVAYDGLGRPQASMGIAAGDVNQDQIPDLYVTHMASEMNVLYVSDGVVGYQEMAMQYGVCGPLLRYTTFGTAFLDIDHDGLEDLVTVNGSMKLPDSAVEVPSFDDAKAYWEIFTEPNQIFMCQGPGKFKLYESGEPLTQRKEISRGICTGDLDNDGDLDLLLVNTAAPARLYRNIATKRGNWLRVRAVEPSLGGRDAYGARVTVVAGDSKWTRWINPGGSYLCSHDPVAHFGLGDQKTIDRIEIRWPDGSDETFAGGETNQLRVLEHGEAGTDLARQTGTHGNDAR